MKTKFFTAFSLKKFFSTFIITFSVILLVAMIWNFFDSSKSVSSVFVANNIISRLVNSIIIAFALTIFQKPEKVDQ